jgi:hypothetical protein
MFLSEAILATKADTGLNALITRTCTEGQIRSRDNVSVLCRPRCDAIGTKRRIQVLIGDGRIRSEADMPRNPCRMSAFGGKADMA